MDFIYAALGLAILLLAGDALVRGAVNLASRLKVPALVVSLTIVSFGTSAPELFISANAVLDGVPGIALGNVVGSNISNVLLVLGLPALIAGIDTQVFGTARSYIIMIASTIAFIALCFIGPLSWIHGLLLLGFLSAVTFDQFYWVRSHKRSIPRTADEAEGIHASMSALRLSLLMTFALVGLPLGAGLLVDGAVNIADSLGIPESAIGLTMVAVGTSLPELATTVVAATRRRADVALGNVIGSNVFNLLGITGVSSLLGTIPVETSFLEFDLWVMLASSLFVAPFVFAGRRICRSTGVVLLALYIVYVTTVLA